MLRILNLNKTYADETKALNHINLTIGKGIFGLIGPNGGGKSTLIRTIATLQEPDQGSIFFDEINLLKQKDKIRENLGYLPQDFGTYPSVSAENLLDHLAILKGIVNSKERGSIVKYLLKLTNLYVYRNKKLGGFSGGMKQRFGIAQALLGDPKLLIVDEPTAGLDPLERARFHNLLSEISTEKTILFSTHIVADVNELCNDMAILNQGEILLQSSPMQAIELLQNKVWSKVVQKSEVEDYTQKYKVISSKFLHGKVLLKVFSDHSVEEFEASSPDLEDVYFSFIKSFYRGVNHHV